MFEIKKTIEKLFKSCMIFGTINFVLIFSAYTVLFMYNKNGHYLYLPVILYLITFIVPMLVFGIVIITILCNKKN